MEEGADWVRIQEVQGWRLLSFALVPSSLAHLLPLSPRSATLSQSCQVLASGSQPMLLLELLPLLSS